MLKILTSKTVPLFLVAVLMPSTSIAIPDCGTSVTECELKQEIKKLKEQRKITHFPCNPYCNGTYKFQLNSEFLGKFFIYMRGGGGTKFHMREYTYGVSYNEGELHLVADLKTTDNLIIRDVKLIHKGHKHFVNVTLDGTSSWPNFVVIDFNLLK